MLLLNNGYREDKISGTYVVDDIYTLDHLAEACMAAIEVLCIFSVVADKEL